MPAAAPPADELTRIAALRETGILDTPSEDSFDDLARVASQICDTPVALVTMVDTNRQWFKARVGFGLRATSRDDSFCAHAVGGREPLVIADATEDPRVSDSPMVTGDPHFRFYAGVPLRLDAGGSAVGTLCVLDHVPRTLSPAQLSALSALASQIVRELRLRRQLSSERATRPEAEASRAGAELALVPGDLLPGGWCVQEKLGEGGVGAVFAARRASGERAAFKVLLPAWRGNTQVVERFVREARLLARVVNPHVVRLLDVGNLADEHGALPYLVMEYLEGMDLARRIEQRGALPWREAASFMAATSEGVAALHEVGALHRDVKPSNVFLCADGVVKVLDFGVATAGEESNVALTRPEAPVGSVPYMAPEQLLGSPLDARTDVWSLGVTLYECLTARMPFAGDTAMAVCASILTKPPLPLPPDDGSRLPRELAALVRACMERASARRPATAGEVAERLRAIVGGAC